jgi:hypothetical protein
MAHAGELPGIFVTGAIIARGIFGDALRPLIEVEIVPWHEQCLLSGRRLRSFLLLGLNFVLSVKECPSLQLFSESLQTVRDRFLYHILVMAPKGMAEEEGGLVSLDGGAI